MENGHHGRPAEDAHEREVGEVESYTWEAVTAGCCYDTGDPGQTDLILAAKLGKSLLEQNEELSADYYKIVRKLEVSAWDIKNIFEIYIGFCLVRSDYQNL